MFRFSALPARVGAICLSLVVASATMATEALTPEMVLDLRHVVSIALSPDATRVAYLLEVPRAADEPRGKPHRELWVTPADGEPRRYVGGRTRVSDPQWAPDGRTLSYVAVGEDEPIARLRAIPIDGGESKMLSQHAGDIAAHRWSPDGKQIAFLAADPKTDEERADEEAGRDWKVWDEDPTYTRLWMFDVATGEERRGFDQDLHVLNVEWIPSGEAVVVRAARTPRVDDDYMFSELYRVARGGAPVPLFDAPGKLGAFEVSPNGKRIAWLGAVSLNDPLAQSLFVATLAGGEPRNLTPDYEGSAVGVAWIDDDALLLTAIEREHHALHRVDAATGARRPFAALDGRIVEALDFDRAGGHLALAAATPEHPAELFQRGSSGAWRRVTRSNPALEGVRLAKQEVIEWEGADGWRISGVLTRPIDFEEGRRYPLVLQVHGGPEGTSFDGWTTSSLYPVQLLAARGFMVLQPNYRGSGGRGVEFSKADHNDLGGKEFDDVLAGVHHLVERGWVDVNRVGSAGWSYGGYFSAWAATRYSERFAASVVAAGLTNWVSFAGTTDIPYEMSLVHWNSWWFDEPLLHWQRSPLAHLASARTPTLVVTGTEDKRVHPEQALQLYTALRVKGVPTQFVEYPREPHGLNEREHRADFMRRSVEWFERWLAEPAKRE